ncbi:MAG: hypothetical protein Q6362_007800, partial [Candidatus Wukongarchaeota archaeon]|nr:hypothetical protein [Candidatus Wukongarchaeota archaeon]
KFQKCGKENCKCIQKGELHGPFLWYVKYQGRLNGKPKYYWKYLGKTITEAAETLGKEKILQSATGTLEKMLKESFSEMDLRDYINKMIKKKRKSISVKILDEMTLREEKR